MLSSNVPAALCTFLSSNIKTTAICIKHLTLYFALITQFAVEMNYTIYRALPSMYPKKLLTLYDHIYSIQSQERRCCGRVGYVCWGATGEHREAHSSCTVSTVSEVKKKTHRREKYISRSQFRALAGFSLRSNFFAGLCFTTCIYIAWVFNVLILRCFPSRSLSLSSHQDENARSLKCLH